MYGSKRKADVIRSFTIKGRQTDITISEHVNHKFVRIQVGSQHTDLTSTEWKALCDLRYEDIVDEINEDEEFKLQVEKANHRNDTEVITDDDDEDIPTEI